ncbi:hypothetical protein VIGAN_10106000 [Vigna angularis var. angularis]|uniref:MADS-box domain-containing protein n=1 Tax=Vigna angularis var. angularis TaxID=157739 RepID=A0A0S3T421_PHAAN|nr:agamous-like MADS-box protein AGL13 [Vigna angularis]BAT99599.1 hypothetical protein VIGAN_10106000 [Vigna angularis var. angularis]
MELKRIENKINRQVIFLKRRSGLIMKAREIFVLCDADMALVVFSTKGVSGLQYRITKEGVGKFISFQCTPVRDDGVVGDTRICMGQERIRPRSPRLLSLHIIGNDVEGTIL